jgi:hypothetical protein
MFKAVSNSAASAKSTTRIPPTETPQRPSKLIEKLTEVMKGLGYYLPQHRNEFKDKLYHFLESGITLTIRNEGTFYLAIDTIKEIDNLLAKEISIAFKLKEKEQNYSYVPLVELSKHSSQNPVVQYSFEMSPENHEIFGDQMMYYTFSSIEDLEESKREFLQFIEHAYESTDEIRVKNRKAWERLLSNYVSVASKSERL